MSEPLFSCPSGAPVHSLAVERRAHVRYPTSVESSCHGILEARKNYWSATIRDISVTGIGLRAKRRFESGTILAIDLLRAPLGFPSQLLARVVHTSKQPDGFWLVGCTITNSLSEDELNILLQAEATEEET